MVMKNNGCSKPRKHGKLIKCDICKKKLDIDEERKLGNITNEKNIEILYCDCGNEIVLK